MRVRINYSIVFVSDMTRSVAFYRDVVGIPLKFETPEWTEFMTDGATLALHKGDAVPPDMDSASAEQAGQCRAGFSGRRHRRISQTDDRPKCALRPRTNRNVWRLDRTIRRS